MYPYVIRSILAALLYNIRTRSSHVSGVFILHYVSCTTRYLLPHKFSFRFVHFITTVYQTAFRLYCLRMLIAFYKNTCTYLRFQWKLICDIGTYLLSKPVIKLQIILMNKQINWLSNVIFWLLPKINVQRCELLSFFSHVAGIINEWEDALYIDVDATCK